jgi:hypothetical protein
MRTKSCPQCTKSPNNLLFSFSSLQPGTSSTRITSTWHMGHKPNVFIVPEKWEMGQEGTMRGAGMTLSIHCFWSRTYSVFDHIASASRARIPSQTRFPGTRSVNINTTDFGTSLTVQYTDDGSRASLGRVAKALPSYS